MTELLVLDEPEREPFRAAVLVRVHEGAVRVGDSLSRIEISGATHIVGLRCDEIRRYDEVLVDDLGANFGARITVSGHGLEFLAPGAVINA